MRPLSDRGSKIVPEQLQLLADGRNALGWGLTGDCRHGGNAISASEAWGCATRPTAAAHPRQRTSGSAAKATILLGRGAAGKANGARGDNRVGGNKRYARRQ